MGGVGRTVLAAIAGAAAVAAPWFVQQFMREQSRTVVREAG